MSNYWKKFLSLILIVGVILVLGPRKAEAAIAFDVAGAGAEQVGGTTITAAHTVTNGLVNCVVIAIVYWSDNGASISGVTYNGVAMTQMFNSRETVINALGVAGFIIAVGTGDGTAHNAVATFGFTPAVDAISTLSFCGVDQTTRFRTATSGQFDTTAGSVSLTVANALANDVVVDGIMLTHDPTSGTTLNKKTGNIGGNNDWGATSRAAALGSTNMSYTFATTEAIGRFSAAPLIPAAATNTARAKIIHLQGIVVQTKGKVIQP